MTKHETTYNPTAIIAERLKQHDDLVESHAELVGVLEGILNGTKDRRSGFPERHYAQLLDSIADAAQTALDKARSL